jgi:hypothetical protein
LWAIDFSGDVYDDEEVSEIAVDIVSSRQAHRLVTTPPTVSPIPENFFDPHAWEPVPATAHRPNPSRVELKKKKTAEGYSNTCIRKRARAMEVVKVGTVPGSDSRSSAVGDWRNMISSLVMWLAVVTGFSWPIPSACMYNMDDTTVFLEQRIGKNRKTYVPQSVKNALRGKNLSFFLVIQRANGKISERRRPTPRLEQSRFCSALVLTAPPFAQLRRSKTSRLPNSSCRRLQTLFT